MHDNMNIQMEEKLEEIVVNRDNSGRFLTNLTFIKYEKLCNIFLFRVYHTRKGYIKIHLEIN